MKARKKLGASRIPTYIAAFMRLMLGILLPAAAGVLVLLSCDGNGVGPSEELPVLSQLQMLFDDRDNRFYAAVTVTPPEGTTRVDTVWTEMYLSSGELADSLDTETPQVTIGLVDNGENGDILPQDQIYARKFDSPLPVGSGGSVRFDFHALIGADTSSATDTLSLTDLRPVILQVTAADSMVLPDEGFYSLDTIRVMVDDPDGLEDIREVSFTSLKPDSTLANQGQSIALADNGDLENWGDVAIGDGAYSRIIILPWDTNTGTYIYRFIARDYSGLVSDTAYHSVVIH